MTDGESGVSFADWHTALSVSSGYDSDEIFEKVASANRIVRHGRAVFDRDSVVFHQREFRWQLMMFIANSAASRGGCIHVLDFGGGLGSVYFQHLYLLSDWPDVKWSVVEQARFVRHGRECVEDERIKFFLDPHECAERGKLDVALFSSSLQYLEKPYSALTAVISLRPALLIIDRIVLTDEDHDCIYVEKVPREIYEASYPFWRLSKMLLIKFMAARGYLEVARYEDGIDPPGHIGLVFKANVKE